MEEAPLNHLKTRKTHKIGTDLALILKKLIVKSENYAKKRGISTKKNEDCTKRSLKNQ